MTDRLSHPIRLMLVAILIAAGCATPAHADTAVMLRAEIEVDDEYVRLGDLFVDAGAVARTPVFRAPAPGRSGVVSADRLARAARAHGLVWGDGAGAGKITITRAGVEVTREDIAAVIREAIVHETGRDGSGTGYAIDFDGTATQIFVPPSVDPTPSLAQLRFNPRSGRFSATIAIAGDDALAVTRQSLTGRAVEVRQMPVLVRPVERDQIVSEDDVEMRAVPVRSISGDSVYDVAGVVGMAARRTLGADQPLRERDLERPRIVQRNSTVTVTYQVPGLVVTLHARALDEGALGDTIRLLNIQSNRIIQGTVIGSNLVEAMPAAANLAEATN